MPLSRMVSHELCTMDTAKELWERKSGLHCIPVSSGRRANRTAFHGVYIVDLHISASCHTYTCRTAILLQRPDICDVDRRVTSLYT